MEILVILTVQSPDQSVATLAQTIVVKPGATREGILAAMLDSLPEQTKGGNVLFFSAEPNRIGGAS